MCRPTLHTRQSHFLSDSSKNEELGVVTQERGRHGDQSGLVVIIVADGQQAARKTPDRTEDDFGVVVQAVETWWCIKCSCEQ